MSRPAKHSAETEAAILAALAEGPASLTPLLARMRANGYPDGFMAENRVKYALYAMHKDGKVRLTRRCTIAVRSQTWELEP
jgi:hypothetical protein